METGVAQLGSAPHLLLCGPTHVCGLRRGWRGGVEGENAGEKPIFLVAIARSAWQAWREPKGSPWLSLHAVGSTLRVDKLDHMSKRKLQRHTTSRCQQGRFSGFPCKAASQQREIFSQPTRIRNTLHHRPAGRVPPAARARRTHAAIAGPRPQAAAA